MNKQSKKQVSVLLPKHVTPLRYRIHLTPDLEKFTYKGVSQIDLHITKPTKEIHLHARDLDVHTATIASESPVQAHAIAYDQERETVVLHFEKPLCNKHTLTLEYSGDIKDGLSGFYRSSYKEEDNTRYLGVTQFEATDARAAFPCIDEPSQKSIFEFSFTVPKEQTVVSNTHEIQVTKLTGGTRHITFAPTPKMSTYVAAFVIGDLDYIEGKTKRGVRVRIYAVRGKKKLSKFALDIAIRGLEFNEEYFGIPYPLETLDCIALPDFSSAAMENWGAITFRETALLIDPEHSSVANKQRCVEVIVHELAHMWFGNLVTMNWWTHLWLNEGFATWMSFYTRDHLFPEWRTWTQFIAQDYLTALGLDSLRSTHPIEVEVNHPREIREIFDAISYRKGASVIRMIADYLGEEKFREGIRYYLKKHSYGNTETEDLWDALAETSGEDVRAIMRGWTSWPGYPLLIVRKVKQGVEIAQERFFASELEAKTKDTTVWKVPLSMSVGSEDRVERLLLTKRTQVVAVDWKSVSWVKLNFKSSAFCRVIYDDALLAGLKEAKETGQLKARDRIGIAADLVAAAKSGRLSNATLLESLLWFKDENYYTIWTVIASGLGSLVRLTRGTALEQKIALLAKDLFEDVSLRTGWEQKSTDGELEILLRSLVLSEAGRYGVSEVVEQARKLFADHVSGKKEISADIRSAVYLTVAHHGSVKELEQFLKLARTTKLQEEEGRLQRAIVTVPHSKLLKREIDFIFSKEVREQDQALLAASMVTTNPGAHKELWTYLTKHWKKILPLQASSALGYYGRLIECLVGAMTDKKELQAVEKFLKKNIWKGGERSAAQGVEAAKANIAWKRRIEKELKSYFTKAK